MGSSGSGSSSSRGSGSIFNGMLHILSWVEKMMSLGGIKRIPNLLTEGKFHVSLTANGERVFLSMNTMQ